MKEFKSGKKCDLCGIATCINASLEEGFTGRWQTTEDGQMVICETVERCAGKPVTGRVDLTGLTGNITAV